jgi:hypothetical protein
MFKSLQGLVSVQHISEVNDVVMFRASSNRDTVAIINGLHSLPLKLAAEIRSKLVVNYVDVLSLKNRMMISFDGYIWLFETKSKWLGELPEFEYELDGFIWERNYAR